MSTNALTDRLVELVAEHGMERERACAIVDYLADRCAGLSVATLHSSSTTSLRHDRFLIEEFGLDRRQITAWLSLLRGTRPVRRRDGGIVGGCPGFIEAAAASDTAELEPRFHRLAERAAGAGCTRRALSKAC